MTRTRLAPLAFTFLALTGSGIAFAQASAPGAYTLPQVLSFPFPAELVSAPGTPRFAWTTFQRGVRSISVADGPEYKARILTAYKDDDGQELSNLAFSADGRYLVYVRGGDHGSNWAAEDGLMPNPTSSPIQPKMQIWSIAVAGRRASSPRRGRRAGAEPRRQPRRPS